MPKPTDIPSYIKTYLPEVQAPLNQVYETIRKAAPRAEESISYGIAAFKQNGKPLIYFAGYKNHVGLYATPTGHEAFKKEFAKYKQGKGSVQFPLDEEMPLALIKKVVQFRLALVTGKEKVTKKAPAKKKVATKKKAVKKKKS